MLRLLANENVMKSAVVALRDRGHEVAWVREVAPGIDDLSVLERALREGRLVLTFDKDFGELAQRGGAASVRGIILLRFSTKNADEAARKIVAALESRDDWSGCFSGIDDARIRMAPLA